MTRTRTAAEITHHCTAVVIPLLLIVPVITPAPEPTKPIKVFSLAGQSNMQGQGVVEMDHPKYYNGGKGNLAWSMEHSASKDMMRHLRDGSGKWVERDDVTIRYEFKDKVRQGKLTIGYAGCAVLRRRSVGPLATTV
jgi:hypothetical protein